MENALFDTALTDNDEALTTAEYGHKTFTAIPIEDALVQRAIDGDEDAFESLFMGTYRYVFATAAKYLNNDQDIYDAIQDTYLKVYKNLSHLEAASSFYPWLHRICENCAKDILVINSHRTVPLEEQAAISDDGIGVNADVAADIAEVLKQLPPEQAELLVRVYYDKLRVAEIARMQGVPVTTVHNRLNAAKKKLKALLKTRGIDRPIYGGDLIALLSAAIRNAIGTELLSMAVAEEILHKVTGHKNVRAASIISHFARRQRSRAALRIATLLLGGSVALTAAVLVTALLLFKAFNGGDKQNDSGTTAVPSPISSVTTAIPTSTTAYTSTTAGGSSDTDTTASTTTTTTSGTTTTTRKPIEFVGSFVNNEVFGTHAEDARMPIATTDGYVYAVVKGDLVSVKCGERSPTVLIEHFTDRYGDSIHHLNVFEGKVYWVSQNPDGRFILNRCESDGSEPLAVPFTASDCTYLTNLLVTKTGVYYCAGIHGVVEHQKSGTLYRADFDFNIQDQLEGVADFTLIHDNLYCLFGNGNYGRPARIDRISLQNPTYLESDLWSYGSLYAFGEYLVLDSFSPYGHSGYGSNADLEILDTASGKQVWRWYAENGDKTDIRDVTEDGTIFFLFNDTPRSYNLRTEESTTLSSLQGTVYGGRRYFIENDILYVSNPDGTSPQQLYGFPLSVTVKP